jgi:AcrR family transcriptional regulator
MQERLSRRDSQARTRARLLESAAEEFARNGLERTSIEQVASGAGYTRGAFYGHFESKEELCLAMLEERFDRYLDEFSRVLATDEEPEIRARRAGDHLARIVESDPASQRLLFEFAAHGLRNERFRRELVERYRRLRERVAEVFRLHAEEYGVRSPVPFDRLALMTFTIANGVALAKLLEPEHVPEDLHGEILEILFSGLRTMVERGAREA